MVLVQKWHFFQISFLSQYKPGKCLLQYSRTRDALLGFKNKNFTKTNIWHFSKGINSYFWSKNADFSNFFLGNIAHKNVFYDILERENAFLGYKNKKFIKSKNWHFFKGVNPWFS